LRKSERDLPDGRKVLIHNGFQRKAHRIAPHPPMTARRFGFDWLSFDQRKHGQTRAKIGKTDDGVAGHAGDSEGKIVTAEGVKGQSRRSKGSQAQISQFQIRDGAA